MKHANIIKYGLIFVKNSFIVKNTSPWTIMKHIISISLKSVLNEYHKLCANSRYMFVVLSYDAESHEKLIDVYYNGSMQWNGPIMSHEILFKGPLGVKYRCIDSINV